MNTQVSYFKKALVVLMAVMIVFTMMPSMAWANNTESSGITLSPTQLDLMVNGTETLTVTGTTESIAWESSNTKVATVDNGIVKAVAVGQTTITATAGSFSTECNVTVWDSCGAGESTAKWTVKDAGATLAISGSGAISDSVSQLKQPWKSQKGNITTVELGNDITSIGKFSFAMFSKLTKVIIPKNSQLEVIGSSAFKTTAKLSSITLPDTLKRIDDETISQKELHFRGTAEQWEALDYPGENVYVLKDGKEEKYVPDPYHGKCGISAIWHFDEETGVLTISGTGAMKDYASAAKAPWYQHRDKITKLAIEAGVTSIGEYAFGGYAAIESVELADTVTVLGKYAFQSNTKLTSIDLSKVATIGEYAFNGCTGLTGIALGSAREIGRNAFYGCSGLTSVSLGSETTRVVSMGIRAFENCTSLTTVKFINVEEVSDYSFKGTVIKGVDLTGIKTIGGAFEGVKTLETVTLSTGLAKIDGAAFSSTGIKEIIIPGTVINMGNGAFNNCTSMRKAVFEEGITSIPYLTFQNNTALEEVTLPASLQSVGQYAFDGCTALKTVSYTGTDEQKKNVEIAANNEPLLKAMGIVAVTGVNLSENNLELIAGGSTATLTATVLPENATDKTVSWSSSADAIATVKEGVVTPVAEGTAKITAKAGTVTAECTVTVKPRVIAVTGLTLDKQELNLTMGGASTTLIAKVEPENATNKTVIWETSAPEVATVQDGVVTPVGAGKAIITAKTEDGLFSASCTVQVEQGDSEQGLSGFTFALEGSNIDSYIEADNLEIVSSGNGKYQLITPVCAVTDAQAMRIVITAPKNYTDEYTVTYTTWNNGDGGSHCYGEKTVASTNGMITVENYYNSWAPINDGKVEYSDFVIRLNNGKTECKVSLSLYDNLNRLLVYPAGTKANEAPAVTKVDANTYVASVFRGKEYVIFARGGAYRVGIPSSKLSISEESDLLASSTNNNSVSLNYTAKDGTEKKLTIRITNELTSPKIAEKIYTLILKVEEPPEKEIEFEKYTATLNGEDVIFDGTTWKIPKITQGDELKITVHTKNTPENATFQWVCGLGGNATNVGNNSSTVLVDTSSLALKDYYYKCVITCGNQQLTTPRISVASISGKTLAAPAIKKQPESAVYKLGEAATVLTVETAENSLSTHYQWYVSEEPDIEKAKAIEGETKYYYMPPTNQVGTLYYFCELYDAIGGVTSEKIQSAFAKIVVDSSDMPWTGEGTASKPFMLSDEDDLLALGKHVAEGQNFAGVYFQFANDITLSSAWMPIGTTKDGSGNGLMGKNIWPFSGTLDGNDCKIVIPAGGKPLFNYVRKATIKNLKIQGSQIDGYGLIDHYEVDYGDLGVYAPNMVPETVNIVNCHILSGTSIKKSGFIGGNASGANIVNITGCTVADGVIIGYGMDEDAIGSLAGGFNGYVVNCTSGATLKGCDIAGGLIGEKAQSMGPCTVTNSAFTGTIHAGKQAGGIIGSGYVAGSAPNSPCVSVTNCYVAAKITGGNYVGGILGGEAGVIQAWGNGIGTIKDNFFYGTLTATEKNGKVGAIIGFMKSLNKYNQIENNYYLDTCGSTNAIGRVDIIDTTVKGNNEGTVYINTKGLTKAELKELDKQIIGESSHTYISVPNLNRTDDPLGADAEKLAKAMSAVAFKDGTVLELLQNSATSLKNWVSGTDYPQHSSVPVAYKLNISGDYKTTYYIGEALDLSKATVTVSYSDGTVTPISYKDLTATGFDSSKRAVQTVVLTYGGLTTTIEVAVLQQASGDDKKDKLMVRFTLLGDPKGVHDSDEDKNVHALSKNNLRQWMSGTYEISINSTVWDLMQKVQKQNSDVEFLARGSQYGTYVYGVSYKGTKLEEFDNGNFSGWMYTVNGTHPEIGVGSRFLENNDIVVFHYTDDYNIEEGSEKWNTPGGVVEEVKDVTTDTKAGTTTAPTDVKVSEKTNADGTKTKVADVKVSADNQKEILKQAKEKKSNEIILVVSSKSVGDATKADVTLDKSFIDSIVKDTNAKLTIKTPFGDKTYTQEELKAMSEAAAGSTVTVAIEKAAEEPTDDAAAKMEKAKSIVKDMKLVARSSKTVKKNIKAVLKNDAKTKASIQELKDLGFTVKYRFYRSTKKAASYKSTVTKKVASYTNTSGKKGTKYFYKVQVRVYDENGKLIAKTALKQCKYATRTWSKAK